MELRLTCDFADLTESIDVAVSCGEATRVGDLVTAVADRVGSGADTELVWLRGAGGRVSPGTVVGAVGLCDGDELRIGHREVDRGWFHVPEPVRPGWRLRVESGPDAGRAWLLTDDGDYVVGRQPECSMQLTDGSVSGRHLNLRISANGMMLTDLGSSNGTTMDGVVLREPAPVATSVALQIGADILVLEPYSPTARMPRPDQGRIGFNRPMRVPVVVPQGTVPLPEVPRKREPQPFQWIMIMAPAILGLGMFFMIGQPWFLLMMIGTPIMFGGQQLIERRRAKRDGSNARQSFDERLDRADEDLRRQNLAAVAALRRRFPSGAEWLLRAVNRCTDVWDRRRGDDFLVIRLGLGSRPAPVSAQLPSVGQETDVEADALARARQVEQRHLAALHVPVTADLAAVGVLGVAGTGAASLAAGWVLQAAVAHSPRDLAIVVLGDDEASEQWAWTKWLPHTHVLTADDRSSTVSASGREAAELFETVERLHSVRKRASEAAMSASDQFSPHILVVVAPGAPISPARFDAVMAQGARYGITGLVFAESVHLLPGTCGATVDVPNDAHAGPDDAVVTWADGSSVFVNCDRVPLESCLRAARALAPVVDVSAAGSGGEVPSSVLLSQALGLEDLSAQEVASRWADIDLGRSAPIGATASGIVHLDLRRDGPHALVAGTTGAGKSEFLQSYLASLAATHSPQQLNFVLVDYKGGAAFRECVGLPHTVGFVTDLDEHLTERALLSLDAELVRRERILNEYEAKDLLGLERENPQAAPPVLLIVIDEFAALVKECEAFVDGVMDIAQRGRSLGVHLILATQKPGGVVNANIQANTEVRIALRMASEDESRDVVDVPDAAHLSKATPGRALLRYGAGAPEVFQATYANSPHSPQGKPDSQVSADGASAVEWVLPWASGRYQPAAPRVEAVQSGVTDLEVLVSAAREAAELAAVPRLHRPWLESLPASMSVAALTDGRDGDLRAGSGTGSTNVLATGGEDSVSPVESDTADPDAGDRKGQWVSGHPVVRIGVADLPQEQAQRPYSLDVCGAGNVGVFGTSRSGKTTLLRTIAHQYADGFSTEDVSMYCLDYASRGLAALADLPHVGGVLSAEQREETDRLFTMLAGWIRDRKRLIGANGVGGFTELRQAAAEPLPFVVVMIDGFENFLGVYEEVEHGRFMERFIRMVAEGPGVGIHFVLAASTYRGLPFTVTSQVSQKLVFAQANVDDYHYFGLQHVGKARVGAGRCWDSDGVEVQVATVSEGIEGREQSLAIRELAAHLQAVALPPVTEVRSLPAVVTVDQLEEPPGGVRTLIPVGLDTRTLATCRLDVSTPALIVGPDDSGRASTMTYLAECLLRRWPDHPLWASASLVEQLASREPSRVTSFDLTETALRALQEVEGCKPVIVIDTIDVLLSEFECAGMESESVFTLLRERAEVLIVGATSRTLASCYVPWLSSSSAVGTMSSLVFDTDVTVVERAGLDPFNLPVSQVGESRALLRSGGVVCEVKVAQRVGEPVLEGVR
ncbi:MAG: FHA domain-containing protein [Actinobacteria bacterium]|nr:FHA domain-containing protein [Actinomycetota bacterium]